MILLGNLLIGIGTILHLVLTLFVWLFLIRAILSWVNPDPSNPIVRFIYGSTDPFLVRIRSKIRPIGMFDLSVMIVVIALFFLDIVLAQSLIDYGHLVAMQSKMPMMAQ